MTAYSTTVSRTRVLVAGLVVLLTILAGLGASRVFHHDSRIEHALAALPGQTLIANFTDWKAVRDELGPAVSSRSDEAARSRLLSRAYDRDFTTTTVLGAFDKEMAPTFGWTVLDSEWEMYGQSKDGAVDVLQLPDGFDFERADRALTALGYAAPDGRGVRFADDQALAAIARGLTPQLSAVALMPGDHLIVTSDVAEYAGLTVDTIHGDKESVLDQDGVAATAAALADSTVSALIDVGVHSCEATSFSEADPGQQVLARRRIAAVGGVHATRGLARSIDGDSRLTVVLDFDSSTAAEADRDARLALAKGVAPDQGGTFDERFTVASADVVGEALVMELAPRSRDTQLLRDLGRGGLLFAAC